jgi:hypothetical protein
MDKKYCIETGWAFAQRESAEKINRKMDTGNILPRSHPPIIEQENERISYSSVDWTIPAAKGKGRFKRQIEPNPYREGREKTWMIAKNFVLFAEPIYREIQFRKNCSTITAMPHTLAEKSAFPVWKQTG